MIKKIFIPIIFCATILLITSCNNKNEISNQNKSSSYKRVILNQLQRSDINSISIWFNK